MDSIDLSKAKLSPLYKRNGCECYLDLIRQKGNSYLVNKLNILRNILVVENTLSHYGIKTKDRADIIFEALTDQGVRIPLAVIEYKAESVYLDEWAFSQAQRCSDSLDCDYTVLVNSGNDFCFKFDRKRNEYVRITILPSYGEMIAGQYTEVEKAEPPSLFNLWEALRDVRIKLPTHD